MLYTLYFLGQLKKQICMCFEINRVQLVHRGVQRELCSQSFAMRTQAARNADFSEFTELSRAFLLSNIEIPIVKILRESALGKGSELSCTFSLSIEREGQDGHSCHQRDLLPAVHQIGNGGGGDPDSCIEAPKLFTQA